MRGIFFISSCFLSTLLFSIADARDKDHKNRVDREKAVEQTPPAWLSRVTGQPPGNFPPYRPVHLSYAAGWSGITAGKVEASFTREGQNGNFSHLKFTGETIGLARKLFHLDSTYESVVDITSLRPTTAKVSEVYSDERRDTLQSFEPDQVTRVRKSSPPQKSDGKPRKVRLPNVYDMQSALLYIRSQPLNPGDKFVFLVYATDSPYLASATVAGPEAVTLAAGTFKSIKFDLTLESIDKKLKLKPYKKTRKTTVWLSDDADRIFLKVSSEAFFGSTFVELQKAEFLSGQNN
ncbi:MAG TPA: DUF3108 domain-containing protein [Chthoniobacterales bacterium]